MKNFAALKSIRQGLKEKYAHKIIDGNSISTSIRKKIEHKINDLNEVQHAKIHLKPVLGYILVGNKPESELYVRLKKAACDKIGIQHQGLVLPEDVTEKTIIDEVNKL
jgi:methylenetetrahydrofolate dehydrogenase (NADP+) / methenyltetrahydrofolate cyclohydrolase